jgi:hypothetical protein
MHSERTVKSNVFNSMHHVCALSSTQPDGGSGPFAIAEQAYFDDCRNMLDSKLGQHGSGPRGLRWLIWKYFVLLVERPPVEGSCHVHPYRFAHTFAHVGGRFWIRLACHVAHDESDGCAGKLCRTGCEASFGRGIAPWIMLSRPCGTRLSLADPKIATAYTVIVRR